MSMQTDAPVVRIEDIARHDGKTVRLQGWVYNKRRGKGLFFILMRDGSGVMQTVVEQTRVSEQVFADADRLTQESSLELWGTVRADARSPGGFEMSVQGLSIVHVAEPYPISKKDHGDAFLMDNRHLWLRSRKQHVILRVRHTIIKAIRDFFDGRGFTLVDSPILTPNACEGTSTLFATPYFDTTAYLTQSGQLYAEAGALAFGKGYCFGPTFRAEKSKTRRHLTEFWMVEPEVAFMDLDGDMQLAEDFLCFIIARVLEKHRTELKEVLERDLSKLEQVQPPFPRISYDDALLQIAEIRAATTDPEQKKLLELEWGSDLGSPHETELTKRYDRPIMVHRYPTECKAFYMKRDPHNPKVALCVDVLAPEGYGEIIGGSQREDDYQALLDRIKAEKLPLEAFQWYLDLRRYGSVPHSGFGLGVERLVSWMCGIHHLREAIPFARTIDRLSP
jgi:asparaginyl-tRNA synthetase